LFVLPLLLAVLLGVGSVLLSVRPVIAAQTFVVNWASDLPDRDRNDGACDVDSRPDAQCTLRAAIQQANKTRGADTIAFAISGPGVQTIRPTSPLPEITDTVTIDGYT
jgi:hypothetical protein